MSRRCMWLNQFYSGANALRLPRPPSIRGSGGAAAAETPELNWNTGGCYWICPSYRRLLSRSRADCFRFCFCAAMRINIGSRTRAGVAQTRFYAPPLEYIYCRSTSLFFFLSYVLHAVRYTAAHSPWSKIKRNKKIRIRKA